LTIVYIVEFKHVNMAEASMAAFGAAIGVMIAMAVVTFGLRGKGHPDPELNA
jgi:hypothetical protein